MNIRNRYPGMGMHAEVAAAVSADIARVSALWSECVARSGGPYLFGAFSIADAMFTPVVFRLRTYGVALHGNADGNADGNAAEEAAEYARRMLATSALVKLDQLAAAEGHAQARYDAKYG